MIPNTVLQKKALNSYRPLFDECHIRIWNVAFFNVSIFECQYEEISVPLSNPQSLDEIIDDLLNLRASLTIKDDNGKCTVDYARENGFQEDVACMTKELEARRDVEHLKTELVKFP